MNEKWMELALKQAEHAGWEVHPNPRVGAVIVRGEVLLGVGYHRGPGRPHAEVEALRDAEAKGNDVVGADIYVTLEPCNHFGRTPPCTEALIAAKIGRCFAATEDPNPMVCGAGIRRLVEAGVACEVGMLRERANRVNEAYMKRNRTGLCYVTLKWAMTLDGKLATSTGSSMWITSEAARADVHRMRAEHDAIMVGTGTVIADNPQLTARIAGTRQPLRVIMDRFGKIPKNAAIFHSEIAPTVLFCSHDSLVDEKFFDSRHIPVHRIDGDAAGLDLGVIQKILVEKYQVTTLFCEGGGGLFASMLKNGYGDRLHAYVAPKIVGGNDAPGPVASCDITEMARAYQFEFDGTVAFPPDIRLDARRRE